MLPGEVEAESLCVGPRPARNESSFEGGERRALSGGDSEVFSGSSDVSLDCPGRRIAPFPADILVTESVLFFRNAAEPKPLSWVWRKNAGSFAPSDCVISDLDVVSS